MEKGDQPPAEKEQIAESAAAVVPTPPAPPKPRRRLAKLAVLIACIAAVALLRLFVYESDIVEGNSMEPGLKSGDFVLLYKLGCGVKAPRRFEVITFRAPDSKEVLIKRVIGLPGEWVWVWEDHVFVNGGRLQEPYVPKWQGRFDAPVFVPPNSIFVLGDNRDDSEDSRVWGPVPLSSVRGRAVLVFYPLRNAGLVR